MALSVAVVGATAARPVQAESKEDARTRKVVSDYATCVVKARHDRVAAAIMANATSNDINHEYSGLIDSDCLGRVAGGVSLAFRQDSFLSALAVALVRSDFAGSGPADFGDRLPLAQKPMPSPEEEATALAKVKSSSWRDEIKHKFRERRGLAALARYGECIAREDPVNSRYWLLTTPDVPEEQSRLAALRPALSDCLDGGTITFSKATLRGLVAINYYRLAMATWQPGLGKTH